MFDLSNIITRYFEVKINGQMIEIEPPTVKMMKKLTAIKKDEDMEGYIEMLARVMSKNRQRKEISVEIVEQMTLDQITEFSQAYFSWLKGIQNDPNS